MGGLRTQLCLGCLHSLPVPLIESLSSTSSSLSTRLFSKFKTSMSPLLQLKEANGFKSYWSGDRQTKSLPWTAQLHKLCKAA